MNVNDHIDISCNVPRFVSVFRLKKDYKDLKADVLLVQYQFWTYYTVRGWYADKNSKASKEYRLEQNEVEFVDFYQDRGMRVSGNYLYDQLPAKYKKG